MKRFTQYAFAPLAALLLSGCGVLTAATAVSNIVSGLSQPATATADNRIVVGATQGLIIAHNGYQGAAAIAEGAVRACAAAPTVGPCPKVMANLDKIAKLSDQAKFLLDQADRGQNVAQNVAEVWNIIPQIRALAGK